MARRTITQRYERTAADLDHAADELAGLAPALHPVHEKTVDVLAAFMEMGDKLSTTGETPAPVRALMTVLKRCRPLLLDQLGSVPPAAIKEFVADIRDQLQSIIDTPDDEGATGDGGAGAARTA